MTVRLVCRGPFDWQRTLEFLRQRATPGVEYVTEDAYQRTLAVGDRHGQVCVTCSTDPDQLELRLAGFDTRHYPDVADVAGRFFDIDAPLDEVVKVLSADDLLCQLLSRYPGIRVPGAWDGFELTIRAILGQQISVKAATTLAGRIARRYGKKIRTDRPETLDRLFPTPKKLSKARLDNIGLVRTRIRTIRDVAAAVVKGDIRYDGEQPPREFRRALTSIRGIGDWTAHYVSMRALKDPDAFPETDLGLIKAVAWPDKVTPRELRLRAEAWRPYRAYAALLLWNSLPGSGG